MTAAAVAPRAKAGMSMMDSIVKPGSTDGRAKGRCEDGNADGLDASCYTVGKRHRYLPRPVDFQVFVFELMSARLSSKDSPILVGSVPGKQH